MACHVDLTTSEVAWEEKMRRDGGMCEGIYGSGCNHGICEFNVVEAHREDEKNTGDHSYLPLVRGEIDVERRGKHE